MPSRFRPWWIASGLIAALAIGIPAGVLLNRTDPSQAIASAPLAGDPLPADVSTLEWTELMPAGWDPRPHAGQAGGNDIARLADDDPVARQMMSDMRESFEHAPVRPELDSRRVRIRGYAVPVGVGWGGTDEFLLVPSFGACIHSPPPPPNQIVYVKAPAKIDGLRAMSVVTVIGRLEVHAISSALATSGYRLVPESVRVER
ncbi:DUF3299 domain-containing protein [Roseateles sp.]|uniref:DUF3299 domain-containing protein n=1 Tax=Roseateles sp. TaxID=1971397 RepID=UPI002F413377